MNTVPSLSSLCECVSAFVRLFVRVHAHMLLDCQYFHVQFIMEEKMNKEQPEHSNRFKTCIKTAHYLLAVEKSHNNLA